MKMIEPYDVWQYEHNSVEAMQVIVEAERRSYADRSLYLVDPDFVNVPKDSLLDPAYLNQRMESFSFNQATKSTDIAPGSIVLEDSEETTHYSIIDTMGTVSYTHLTLPTKA